jgi:hypothetical protein
MPKMANTGRDQDADRTGAGAERVRPKIGNEPEIEGESVPTVSGPEGAARGDKRRDQGPGAPEVSPADGVLDPSLNESSRH